MNPSQFHLYTTSQGEIKVDVLLREETVWLTQDALAALFNVQRPSITKHLKNIFDTNELNENSVCSILERTAADNKKYKTKYYNLDAIIAVGYRVNTYEATQFRIWATKTLREFIIKGFVLDDERLKQGNAAFGKDYFDELLARIREIRASERRFYQKITDIYSTSIDYDKNSPVTKEFFATVQNKLHWAITGKTAAEIIHTTADATKPNMGLTTWKNAPEGKILSTDVVIAKNYLTEPNIKQLERLVSAYFDLAEDRAARQIKTTMSEWVTFLNKFLDISEYPILADAGKISAEEARIKDLRKYYVYSVEQDQRYVR